MRVTLANDFVIDIDDVGNYTLNEIKGTRADKDGNEIEVLRNWGYHSNLRNAVNKFIHLRVISANETLTLAQFVERWEKLQHDILKKLEL